MVRQARAGQAKTELLFWSQWEVLHKRICHPVEFPYLLSIHRRVASLVREPHHLEEVEHCKIVIFASSSKEVAEG